MLAKHSYWALAAGALFFSACLVTEQPLAPLEDSVLDEQLLGAWFVFEREGEPLDPKSPAESYHFGHGNANTPENLLQAMVVSHGGRSGMSMTSTSAWSIEIGEWRYLSFVYSQDGFLAPEQLEAGENNLYVTVRYEIHENELWIYGLDESRFEAARQQGDLAGPDPQPGVIVSACTSSSEELHEYLAAGNELFSAEPTLRLQRVE